MKKAKLLTLILLTAIISNLSAQEDDLRKFRFGLHFTPNIAWLNPSSEGYEKNGSSMGFSYGLSAEFFLAKNFRIFKNFYFLPIFEKTLKVSKIKGGSVTSAIM